MHFQRTQGWCFIDAGERGGMDHGIAAGEDHPGGRAQPEAAIRRVRELEDLQVRCGKSLNRAGNHACPPPPQSSIGADPEITRGTGPE
jgi:hypothetical protein